MARLNKKVPAPAATTFEGAPAKTFSAEKQLRRSVMNCLLWEGQFYEDGEDIAARIRGLIKSVKPETVAALAHEARTSMNLRHVPLLIAREMLHYPEHKALVADTLEKIIQRPDELTEFLAIYWKDAIAPGQQRAKQKIAAQAKKGLARAFAKFNAYSLAKYNRDGAIKLRDVLFLTHAKPRDAEQAEVWKKLVDGTLESPDTWEVELSAGKDKKETFERLISEKKLGALAMLRNLRNMKTAGVDRALLKKGLAEMDATRVFPYRFITAARFAPEYEPELEAAMFKSTEASPKISGKTVLLIDVSGSMSWAMSSKSEASRIDAACGLAVLAREVCDEAVIYTFSDRVVHVPSRRGFALRDAITRSQPNSGTRLGEALHELGRREKLGAGDRIIVFTDEQSHDRVGGIPGKGARGYMINVASAKNGVGTGAWERIDGFSESVIRWIVELESGRYV